MATKKRRKLIEKRNTAVYKVNWKSKRSIMAIILIIIGSLGIISTFIYGSPSNNVQCSTGPILNPNYIDFLIFGFGIMSLMVGIAMLYAGREREVIQN